MSAATSSTEVTGPSQLPIKVKSTYSELVNVGLLHPFLKVLIFLLLRSLKE